MKKSIFVVLAVGLLGGCDSTPRVAVTDGSQCISGKNGPHWQLTWYLETILKDPDSYEHINTERLGDRVIMTYRAKNSFGGYAVNSIDAQFDIRTCRIKSINKHE